MKTLRRFGRSVSGASAVEFAAALPFLVLLFFGGFTATQAVFVGRKVTITTRALADLVSRSGDTITKSQLDTIRAAAQQIIAPFSGTLMTRLTLIKTDSFGLTPKVVWSSDPSTYPAGKLVVLPAAMQGINKPSMSYIFSEVAYTYTPVVFNGGIGPYNISDSLYMLPRTSASITCTGC
jgi:Flp pilus assembly protein TadG